MKKLLKINVPIVNIFGYYNIYTSLLEKYKINEYDIILENYIQVIYNKKNNIPIFSGANSIEQYNNAFLHTVIDKNLLVKSGDDVLSKIIFLLDNDYYVHFYCNTYYVDEYVTFNKVHRGHTLLIYGYDLSRNIFNASDFFNFVHASHKECDIGQVIEGLKNNENVINVSGEIRRITGIRKNEAVESPLDFNVLYNRIKEFLNYDNLRNCEVCSGAGFLVQLYEQFYRSGNQISGMRIMQNFHFAAQHIMLMKYRAEWIYQKYYNHNEYKILEESFEALERECLGLRNSLIKNQSILLSGDESDNLIQDIIDKTKRLGDGYILLLNRFVNAIEASV